MRDTERDRRPVSEGLSERLAAQSDVRTLSGSPRTQIGPYQLIAKIGEGGMGTVWLTKLPGPAGFNKLAVVKELRAELSDSPAFVEMFLNEARLAARLTHPNVVHTYGANEDQGRLYIAMEYLDGQPWSAVRHVLWSNRSLPLALHLKVLADTLSGLHYAHELRDYDGAPLQVVHRDMSPQNVFVTYDGQVKVVDFGVARAVTSHTPEASGTPMFVGKVAYSGPEQLRGDPVDRRADVFAVGVMLWEACAGKRLMEGQDRSEAVRTRASEPAPRIREVVSSMPRALADICDRAIAINPSDRFATAAEFREALINYLDETSPDVDEAQLGQLVASAFRDERTRINALIERSLMQRVISARPSQAQSPATDEHLIDTLRPPPGPVEHTIRADLSELASVSKLEDDDAVLEASISVAARTSDARRTRLIGAIAAGAVLVLLGFSWWRVARAPTDSVTATPLPTPPHANQADSKPAEPSPSEAPRAQAQAPAETARRVRLQIKASPTHASIFMDGTPLSNPYSGDLKADGELHLIRVSAPGLQTQERVVELDTDKALDVTLAPIAHRAGAHRQPAAQRASASSVKAPTEAIAPEEPITAPAPQPAAAPRRDEPDFDTRITPDSKSRPIYEEDPY